MQINACLCYCYIDYTKAFNRIRHDELFPHFEKFNIDGKDVTLLLELSVYWQQIAVTKINKETSKFQYIIRRIRHDCLSSLLDLFLSSNPGLIKENNIIPDLSTMVQVLITS